MKIVDVKNIIGSEREVSGPGWTSRRLLLKKDRMGFSFHETIIPAGAELALWYKNHLEAVYCVAGNGSIVDMETGEKHEIHDGILYALDKHDRHILRATEELVMACCFNPPVTGNEVHQEDGSYAAPETAEA